jgi:hypothetical protein
MAISGYFKLSYNPPMKKYWHKKILTSWVAIFAILLSALAPSISSAFTGPSNSNIFWTEICSAANLTSAASKASKKVLIKLSINSPATSDAHEGKHCPYCLPHAGNFALPPAVMPCCAVAVGHDAFPPLYYQAPSLLFSWVTAKPRGPPQVS